MSGGPVSFLAPAPPSRQIRDRSQPERGPAVSAPGSGARASPRLRSHASSGSDRPAVPFPPDSGPDQPVSGPRPVTAECSLEFCCFQHLPASIFIITVSSASPKGPQDHFLLIFVKTRERSVYSKRCHELADAAGQAWGRRGQPVWGPPGAGAEAVVWPGRALARAPPGRVPPLETLPRSVFHSLWPSEWPCLCHFDTLIPWKTPLGCRPAPAHQTHPLLGHLDFSEQGQHPPSRAGSEWAVWRPRPCSAHMQSPATSVRAEQGR